MIKQFGELEEGDFIQGIDGPVKVKKAYDHHIPDEMYKITIDTGETFEASGNHLWYVETDLHRENHKARLRAAKKALKYLSIDSIKLLIDLASYDEDDDVIEVSLNDMNNVLDLDYLKDKETLNVIARVAESIGHIVEEKHTQKDLYDDSIVNTKEIKKYDGKLFAQQILCLTQRKPWNKYWDIIVGEVVTTKDLLELKGVEIPVVCKK